MRQGLFVMHHRCVRVGVNGNARIAADAITPGGKTSMIIYEVNLTIDVAIIDDYRGWLQSHVDEILQLPGFLDARILEVLDPAPASGQVGLCVQYTLDDRASLERYLIEHAPRMRREGSDRFDGRFLAHRRVLRG